MHKRRLPEANRDCEARFSARDGAVGVHRISSARRGEEVFWYKDCAKSCQFSVHKHSRALFEVGRGDAGSRRALKLRIW